MDLGMDTRAYRLEACKSFLNGCFDVDMASINDEKRAIFNHVLQNPASKCKLATQPIPEVFLLGDCWMWIRGEFVQGAKLQTIMLGQPTAPDDCVEATIDLDFLGDKTLQEGLAEAGFTADKPSLFVAEGLIMYLGPEGCLSLSAPTASAWWHSYDLFISIGLHSY